MVLISAVVLALVTGLGVVYLYRHLNGNIETVSLDEIEGERPEKVYDGNGEPLNILVMGDDTRDGDGNAIDDEGGGGSDTTILVHLSADRSRAYAVSIPRDSIVDRPECDDNSDADADVMWNAAYSVGGELCTIEQFEANTDILIDHFVVVDFNGFGDMVDAVGGVPVCVPEDIDDPGARDLRPRRGPVRAQRRRGARLRPGPVRRRAGPAERHQPHQAPADLHRRPRAQGQVRRHADAPRQGGQLPRRRHRVPDDRPGPGLDHPHSARSPCSCRASAWRRSSS